MESEISEKKKRKFNPDRIVLEPKSVEVAKQIAQQIEAAFNGVIKLTNKEIANFLIQTRAGELSSGELKAVREIHFDEVRAAQWAVQKLKRARDEGESITLNEILGQLESPLVKRASTKLRGKRSKKVSQGPELSNDTPERPTEAF